MNSENYEEKTIMKNETEVRDLEGVAVELLADGKLAAQLREKAAS